MIRSMTGFGKGEQKCPYGKITVEIKTLNHKTLNITCNPFNGFFLLEERMNKVFQGKVFRGKVFVRITRESADSQKNLRKIEVNEDVARDYLKKIKKMQKNLGIGGHLQIQDLITFPGVTESSAERKEEEIWPYIKNATQKALKSLVRYRQKEGQCLAVDFNKRLRSIKESIREIKKYEKQSVSDYRRKMVKSIRKIAESAELDKGRLETEVALFARNCDVAEEVTRLAGHVTAYKDAMKKVKTDVGKKLDFIAQEMQREANTIGAKSSYFRISKAVIELKSEIEKIREQIRNIE
ncbi:YicC/YloC family endoribonuclease [Candidatus Omnitrophota bacterium]